MRSTNFSGELKSLAARAGIIVFFIMAFEVMIMISPFAFFFYSVFNPILHWLQDYSATRWLTSFFLPHMILPPTMFLKAVRILGSVLFVIGSLTFFICAFQVYFGKIFKWGVASKGLYGVIRHPQYLALGLWGTGMSILWPRFLVLASLSFMFILYYFLSKDEERRMFNQFGGNYREYMERTGAFLPRSIEVLLSAPFEFLRSGSLKSVGVTFCIPLVVIGTGFLLRAVTLNSLLIEASRNVTLVSILPEDEGLSRNVLNEVFAGDDLPASLSFIRSDKDYLGYVMPPDYVMQGMIADTGGAFHLHQQHHTFALIADWIFNPFEHLRRSPSAQMAAMHNVDPVTARRHHCPVMVDNAAMECVSCPLRRIIFLEIDHRGNGHLSKTGIFSFNATRVPICFMDINTQTGEIIKVERVGTATAWKDVPTPAI
ncbi:MAG: isoprenylcysteine carboxylmethyltransferase family protein [Syntrophobacteraceae bacterium]